MRQPLMENILFLWQLVMDLRQCMTDQVIQFPALQLLAKVQIWNEIMTLILEYINLTYGHLRKLEELLGCGR